MPRQKSRSRKRHQFWCHRRKSAPIWSLVLSTTDKIRQFGAENKIFSRKAHKNRCFVLYPQPAIFGVSRWLPFEGEKRNLSKWFIFDPSRCLPDGREIFKTIHKNRVFVLYHLRREKLLRQRRGFWLSSLPTYWGKKNIFSKGLIFGFSRDLPLEEENFEAGTTFDLSKWEQVKKYSKQR